MENTYQAEVVSFITYWICQDNPTGLMEKRVWFLYYQKVETGEAEAITQEEKI